MKHLNFKELKLGKMTGSHGIWCDLAREGWREEHRVTGRSYSCSRNHYSICTCVSEAAGGLRRGMLTQLEIEQH